VALRPDGVVPGHGTSPSELRDTRPVQPETRYAKSGNVNIAYQVAGDGPPDLVAVDVISHIELDREIPSKARFFTRLASICRLFRVNQRGTGMSDRDVGVATLETRMDDIRAVLDAVGSERAVLFGLGDASPLSVLFAATYPGRTAGLILMNASPRFVKSPSLPWLPTREETQRQADDFERRWGDPAFAYEVIGMLNPSAPEEELQSIARAGDPFTRPSLRGQLRLRPPNVEQFDRALRISSGMKCVYAESNEGRKPVEHRVDQSRTSFHLPSIYVSGCVERARRSRVVGVGLFEQQFSDEQVADARRKIAAGTSLRAAAAEIGCAPSTLSVRIKKAEAAEADARVGVGIRVRKREDTVAAGGDPVEVLRGALHATKANGQPDWQIRVSAARMLAALPPEESEPEPEPDSATLVYDLPPGSSPILHCAPPPLFGLASTSKPPAEPLPEPGLYVFQGEKGPMIPLVKHEADDGAPVHFLHSHEAAADILRAFGGDPRFLDTISPDPQPKTP
jgi:pimeloyl-ACP methyl ester carboxylesterase